MMRDVHPGGAATYARSGFQVGKTVWRGPCLKGKNPEDQRSEKHQKKQNQSFRHHPERIASPQSVRSQHELLYFRLHFGSFEPPRGSRCSQKLQRGFREGLLSLRLQSEKTRTG